ncbi:hypothetical protein GCM10028813_44020 [Ramlibacter alkalitolerans]
MLGVVVGSVCALVLSWFGSPEASSQAALHHGYEGPQSVTDRLLVLDILFTFLSFFAGSLVSFYIAKSRPYFACCTVGAIGWFVYFCEVGGTLGMFSGEYPLWYEFAPTHLASSLLAAWVVARRGRSEA